MVPGSASTRERLMDLARESPFRSYADMAREVGVTRERVRQILSGIGPAPAATRQQPRLCIHCGEALGRSNRIGLHLRCVRAYNMISVCCSRCGGLFKRHRTALIASARDPRYTGKQYCPNCYGKIWVPCHNCGELFMPGNGVTMRWRRGGNAWCSKPECRKAQRRHAAACRKADTSAGGRGHRVTP